jgi:SAM-dependent methyltransferase
VRKSLEKIILDLIELFKPHFEGLSSVIDIGTGTSIPIHVFADFFPAVTYKTVDVVDMRQRKQLPFIIYDGKKLPFADFEFDASILNETLHHCDDPDSVLSEAKRVSKLVFVIEHFPNPDTNIDQLVQSEIKALTDFDMTFKIYKPFTELTLNSLFEKSGLRIADRIEVPYYGEREIKKYCFKLMQ